MSYLDKYSTERERERIRRELEVKKLLEEQNNPADLEEIKREIHGEIIQIGNMKIHLHPIPKRKKAKLEKSIQSKIESAKEIQEERRKEEMEFALREIKSLRQLLTIPLAEIYDIDIPEKPNRYSATRMLSEKILESELDGNEIALFTKLIRRILKSKGKEDLLLSLYIESII